MEKKMNIDEKLTVQFMKKQLQGLKVYCANMRLQSILYGDEVHDLQVEDELGNYLNFSKSVVQITKQKFYNKEDPILCAMAHQQHHREILQERDARAYLLLQGIAQLKEKERELLLDVYVRQYSRDKIMAKAGGIVESTYHRRLHRAIIALALVLECERYVVSKSDEA